MGRRVALMFATRGGEVRIHDPSKRAAQDALAARAGCGSSPLFQLGRFNSLVGLDCIADLFPDHVAEIDALDPLCGSRRSCLRDHAQQSQ